MIPQYLSMTWTSIAPAVASHLWQSTLFAISAGLLTLTLRKNHARARYGLWQLASMKFLVPFSLLISVGSHMATPRTAAGTPIGFYSAVEEVATVTGLLAVVHPPMQKGAVSPSALAGVPKLGDFLPPLLATVWLCGFAAVFCLWLIRWRRISATLRGAAPLLKGREVEALRRMERLGGIKRPVAMRLSESSLEPAVFGIARPVIVWPAGISRRLEDAHLEAILAHELWHIRRRDNLEAALHMAVEAIFWFYPVVWWLGGRLLEERERACDEAVLQSGSERQVYAESILKACEFCLGSPLACAAGVTGSDLTKRIIRIMTHPGAIKLDVRKKLMLAGAAIVAIGVPVMFGLANAPQTSASSSAGQVTSPAPKFEVASIKLDPTQMSRRVMFRIMDPPNDGRFYSTGPTLRMLLRDAYDVQDSQIAEGPAWMNSARFDIQAKSDAAVNNELKKLSAAQGLAMKHRMLQALLTDRFKLQIHHETKNLPIYALVVAKGRPRIQEVKGDNSIPRPGGPPRGVGIQFRDGGAEQAMVFQDSPLSSLAQVISQQLGRTVLDKTGLTGNYNFNLKWVPDEAQRRMFAGAMPGGPGPGGGAGIGGSAAAGGNTQSAAGMAPPASNSTGPSIFTAVREQLGLKLVSQKGPVDILVIEHAEKPSED